MKPISRRLKAALPSLIIVPAMIQMASAAPVPVDANGSLTIPGNYNGGAAAADSITATGPTDGVTVAPYTVLINSGATLTGDAASAGIVDVTSTGYIVDNRGNLSSTIVNGVSSTQAFELRNSNNISGIVGVNAIAGGATINNSGTITGTGGTALQLGDTAGVGNNVVSLSSGSNIAGNIIATGTGNTINAESGRIFGDVTGVQNINVLTNGRLVGAGTWGGNINVASGAEIGAIALGSLPYGDYGIINTTGTVTHAAGSEIRYRTDPSWRTTNNGSDATLIRSVAGNYDATNATIAVTNSFNEFALNNGDRIIVEAAGGVVNAGNNSITYEGSSQSVIGNYFSTLSISPATGDLVLNIDHNFEALPGLSTNQSSLGAAFDTFMDNEEGLPDGISNDYYVRELVEILDAGTLEGAQEYLAFTVAPTEAALGVASSAMNSNYRLHRMTQDHLANARNSGETITTTHTAAPVTDSKGGMISGGETTTSTSSVGSNGNLWGAYSYDDQNNNDFLNGGSYDGEAQSFTAGFDYRVAPNLLLGILVDGTENDVDIAGSTATTESIRAALYGTYGASTGLYVDFLAGYGSHDLDLTDATSIQALTTVGFAMGDDRIKHGPYIGAEYQNMDVDGFDYFGLVNVDDFHSDSLRGLIGYRVNANLGTFRPYASVAYAHEFRDDQPTASASFLGLPFQVKGAEAGSSVLVGAGTGISLNQNLVLDLGYRGEFTTEGDGLDTHGGTIGLNYAF